MQPVTQVSNIPDLHREVTRQFALNIEAVLLRTSHPVIRVEVFHVIPKELTSNRDVVKKALPAVISIEGMAAPTPVKAKQPRKRVPADDQHSQPGARHGVCPRRPTADTSRVVGRPAGTDWGWVGIGSGPTVISRCRVQIRRYVRPHNRYRPGRIPATSSRPSSVGTIQRTFR